MDSDLKGFDVRDIFWNYPQFFSQIIKITNPLPFIVLSIFLGYFVFTFLTSNFALRFVEGRDKTEITEGVIGALVSTNPMFITQNFVDRDFYNLIYEKFVETDSNGLPVANIALNWENLSDLEYVFTIRNDVFWHDGTKLTADDIVWNFETAISLSKNFTEETYGSALEGVKVEKVSEDKVKFTLEEKNATFWEAVSVYLIPKHIYESVSLSDFAQTKNKSNPIGCGKYRVTGLSDWGFKLEAFENHWEKPTITKYRYLFFEDYESLNNSIKNNELDIITVLDLENLDNFNEYPFFELKETILFDRQRLIYFNTRREKYSNDEFRKAITLLVDKERLLERANIGGSVLNGPISAKSWAFSDTLNYLTYNPNQAKEILESLGFVKDLKNEFYVTQKENKILSLELSFFENNLNTRLALVLQELLREEGVLLKLKPLNYDQLIREILPTRNFELLLYEIEITADPDQYNLWHSLRIDHPMLNISGYDYSRVDILLERARTELDREKRKADYLLFQRYLIDDAPVIFLYNPKVYFIVNNGLAGFEISDISSPSYRYENISEWFWKY